VVQLGAFSNRTNANALVERLRRRGYTAFVQELNNGGTRLFRVRVGPRASREQAESLRMRIRREMPVEAQIRPY
jgi:DedD protein